MVNLRSKKRLLFLLFLVFLIINTKWLWQLVYPIKYEKEINYYSAKYDLDPFLILAIIQVETKFNEDKISQKGATGLMQLMPETADWIINEGNFPNYTMEEILDPEVNIELGSWYLAKIYRSFDENMVTTIAAYNAGPGNVNKWLESGIWDGTIEKLSQIPFGETRHYVQRVLYFYDRYQWIYEFEF